MIIWLSSYPKSGNTFVRSLLSSYFFSEDGNFDFSMLKNIPQFPSAKLFKKLGLDLNNEDLILQNYIRSQEEILKKNTNQTTFLKTHSTLHNIKGNPFTNLKNTLGVIYIVRDPRNIVQSYANHNQISFDQSVEILKSFTILGSKKEPKDISETIQTHLGSWSSHYNVWKELEKLNKYILIKYEDLVLNTKETFIKILKFINNLTNSNLVINYRKLENTIHSTTFERLQELEKKDKFPEAKKDLNNQDITFFKYGTKNDWKKTLSNELINKIETAFSKEMKELGYL
jgi:hypothetical protein